MTAEQEFLVEGIVGDMAKWLMEDRNLSLQVALGLIYNSKTFEQLQNPALMNPYKKCNNCFGFEFARFEDVLK